MTAGTKTAVEQVAAIGAAARSGIYSYLADAFRWPEPSSPVICGELTGESTTDRLTALVSALPFDLGSFGETIAPTAGVAGAEGEIEAAYMSCFEFGSAGAPPCFAYEAEHGGGRLKVMEDVLRFYDHFGLDPAIADGGSDRSAKDACPPDRPDHISTECEFMHYLTYQEAITAEDGGAPAALRRAQFDFLRIHLTGLAKSISDRIGDRPLAFYPPLARFAAAFTGADLKYLTADRCDGPGPAANGGR